MLKKLASLTAIVGAAAAATLSVTAPAASYPTEWMVCMAHAEDVCSFKHPNDPAGYEQCMANREAYFCAGLPGDPNG